MKLRLKSLYNISEDRTADIEQIKTQYQNDKDTIWLMPDSRQFKEIDKLLDEIERIKYLEEKYTNPNSDEGVIVRGFQSERSVKETRLMTYASSVNGLYVTSAVQTVAKSNASY